MISDAQQDAAVHYRMIKSRRMRWAGDVSPMGEKRMHIGFVGKARKKETSRKT
jgi:hypothetical protein